MLFLYNMHIITVHITIKKYFSNVVFFNDMHIWLYKNLWNIEKFNSSLMCIPCIPNIEL